MQQLELNPLPREDILLDLRAFAVRGTTVRELVRLVQTRLDYGPDALIPVLFYLRHAFNLELLEILPIREWLGSERDNEIDGLILPLIARNGTAWQDNGVPRNGTTRVTAGDEGAWVANRSGTEVATDSRV